MHSKLHIFVHFLLPTLWVFDCFDVKSLSNGTLKFVVYKNWYNGNMCNVLELISVICIYFCENQINQSLNRIEYIYRGEVPKLGEKTA